MSKQLGVNSREGRLAFLEPWPDRWVEWARRWDWLRAEASRSDPLGAFTLIPELPKALN